MSRLGAQVEPHGPWRPSLSGLDQLALDDVDGLFADLVTGLPKRRLDAKAQVQRRSRDPEHSAGSCSLGKRRSKSTGCEAVVSDRRIVSEPNRPGKCYAHGMNRALKHCRK